MPQNYSSENSTPNSSSDGPFFCKSYLSQPAEVPTNDTWYHGELVENCANRLLKGNQAGTFLVRRNGKTRYYLSIVDSEQNIRHLPIRQINSVYFFEGKKFDQLQDIVSNYSLAAIPFKKDNNETLHSMQEYLDSKYICNQNFEPSDINDLTASVGDILSVSETDDPNWFIGRNERNGSIGMVPSGYLEPLVMEVESMNEVRYFHDTDSTDSVRFQPIGAFLVRKSSKGPDTYALLVKTQCDLVEKFLIVGSPARGFNVAGRTFRTIGHVINRYCERSISGGVRLTHAVFENLRKNSREQSEVPKSMNTSQCLEYGKSRRRMFRGVSIDTSILPPTSSTSSYLSPAPSSSSAASDITSSAAANTTTTNNTTITGVRNTKQSTENTSMFDHFNEEDCNENLEISSTVIATATALRKSREDKAWKECWLSLSDLSCGSSQLAIFDSMGTKRRQLIDLTSCTLFWLDESVFGVDGSVYISASYPQQAPIFLCFRPYSTFLKWIRLMRSRSIFQDVPPPMSQSTISYNEPTSQMSLLCVEIEKYRSDTLKSDMLYSANVLLNGIKICSSNSFAPTSKSSTDLAVVVIDSKFVLPCIPTCSTSVQLAIVGHQNSNKRGRPCGVSSPVILPDSTSITSIHHVPPSDIGFTFRAEKHRFPILAYERYRPLLDAIRDSPTELFQWSSQVLPQQHKIFLYSCTSYLYAMDPINMSHVFRRIISDVLATSTPEDVFRKDSMATGIVTQCLRHLFKTPFDEFLIENSAFVHACKTQNSNMEQAVEILVNFVDQRLLTIPLACRLLAIAAECAKNRFKDETHLVKRTLSALLILRVLNPIIFTTLSNGGTGSQIAKLVQTCANSAASQTCDEQLSESAATIRRLFDRLILFADQKEDMITTENEHSSTEGPANNPTMSSEWLSCIAHLIGFSLTLKPGTATTTSTTTTGTTQMTQDDVHNTLPLAVLELVRLHQ